MDLNSLAQPTVKEITPESLIREMVEKYEETGGLSLPKDSPESFLLYAIAYIFSLREEEHNETARQNLLAFAKGSYLDHLGALMDVSRLEPAPAKTTLEYALNDDRGTSLTIPQGTRLRSNDGKVFFAADKLVVADVGTNLIQVPATCTEAGTTGNGYLPGTISSPVDVLPYVLAVKNITQTTGGTDAEEDDSFRTRIQQSSERLSPGTGPAYKFYARSAYAGIIDVAVYSSQPGVVTIVPLLSGGEVPGQEILDLVSEYCSDDKRRALCDTIEVIPPVIVEYEINVDYWILRNSSALADSVESAILEACNEFASKLKERLGLPVVPETLGATLNKITGVARAVVVQPTYTELNVNQVAISTGSTVNCQGEM